MKAFTYLELMICLAIISILALISNGRNFHLLSDSKSKADLSNLLHLIEVARNRALFQNLTIAWCQTKDLKNCSNGSTTKQLFYVYKQQTQIAKEDIITVTNINGLLHFRTFPKDPQVKSKQIFFRPNLLGNSNSTIWYCQNKKMKWIIVLNKTSETRVLKPNAEGVIKNAVEKELVCD